MILLSIRPPERRGYATLCATPRLLHTHAHKLLLCLLLTLAMLATWSVSASAAAAAGHNYSRYARQWGFCEVGEHGAIGCRSVPAYLRYRGDKNRWKLIGNAECVRLPSFKLMRKLFLPASGWLHKLGENTSNWNRRFIIGKRGAADVLVWVTSSNAGPLWVSWWDFHEDPC